VKRFAALIALAIALPVRAQGTGTDAPFANRQLREPALEAKARTLMGALRCIQCQGQSIADSDAPIAGAMRSEVRQRIAAGENPEAVKAWLISRYGQWVSFEPPASGSGLVLWLAPALLLLAGLWISRAVFTVRKP
jgi:cytochrome c-type biogenesis protein CcmH